MISSRLSCRAVFLCCFSARTPTSLSETCVLSWTRPFVRLPCAITSSSLHRPCFFQPVAGMCKSTTQKRELPTFNEDDLEEDFMRGHGPGGQHVAKNSTCVLLKHKPTGVFVKCHESRSLVSNRKTARLRLREKLDFFYNGENSLKNMELREASANRKLKKQKTREKLEKLKTFKEREGLT